MTKDKLKAAADEVERIMAAHEEAAGFDAGFDGGEFSGPAHSRMEQREIDECCKKHGLDHEVVWGEVLRRANEPTCFYCNYPINDTDEYTKHGDSYAHNICIPDESELRAQRRRV